MTKGDSSVDADWHSSLGYLLHETSRLLMRATRDTLEQYGITVQQYFLLRNLWELSEPTQRELARRLGMEESRLALVIDALEAAGLVARRRSTTDRRKVQVILTRAGARLRYTLRDSNSSALSKVMTEIVGGLSQRRVDELRVSLRHLKSNLETVTARSNRSA